MKLAIKKRDEKRSHLRGRKHHRPGNWRKIEQLRARRYRITAASLATKMKLINKVGKLRGLFKVTK